MRRTIHVQGEVVDQQTLLDGMREFSIDGAGEAEEDGGWGLTLTFRWPKEAGAGLDEGDLSVSDPDGASLYGTLQGGAAEDAYDEDVAGDVVRLTLVFEIRSGDGALTGYQGSARVEGDLAGETALLTVTIDAEAAPAGDR